jgi:D-glycero-D-manno-heptose 1,7-bisphosphate phosphatase
MRGVFVHRDSVLRDSRIDPRSSPETWRLTPATLEALRLLATEDTLVFILGASPSAPIDQVGDGEPEPGLEVLARQVEAAGGRVDALIWCPHGNQGTCKCWGEFPGALWVAASQFSLKPDECYVLGDGTRDVMAAYAAGARPMIVLCTRTIGEVLGNQPDHKDLPIAMDLTTAVGYIGVEEDTTRQLGHTRHPAAPIPPDEVLYADPEALPAIKVTSPLAQSLQARLLKSRAQLRDMVRWLTFFVLGAVGLSLGIAYMLTHLYRVQPFPDFVYYVTLQFIPRPWRGALFIVWGAGVLVLAVRSFYRSANVGLWPKHRS